VLLAFFESHKNDKTWTSIPALARAVADLGTVAARVGEILESTATPSGASASKAACLDSLIAQAHPIAAALHAFFVDNADADLATQTDLSATDLRKGSEAEIVARCSKVLSLAKDHVDDLGDYDVEPADLTALEKKIDAFAKACPKPRQNVASKSAATKALPQLFQQARRIIDTRIDRLMVKFKTAATDFYNEYRTARKVVEQPATLGEAKSANNVVSSPATTTPATKAA
jgi:hypothetical protein